MLVSSIFYFFISAAGRAVDTTIKTHALEVRNLADDLKTARERMNSLANPSSIETAKPGAKAYADKAVEAQGSFDDFAPKMLRPIKSTARDDRIEPFNQIISNNGYTKTVLEASQVLKADKAFLIHHAAVMKAVANILEYNPTVDLSTNDTEQLNQRLSAAEAGLAKTIERLNDAPKYESDKTLEEVKTQVQAVQQSRDKLASDLLSDKYQTNKQEFIDVVQSAQKVIIANRSAFWVTESQKLIGLSQEKQIRLEFYLKILNSI